MSFLQTITPINLLEEKEKFLANTSYNPQFKYSEEIDQKKLYKYGHPQKKYLELAQEIVDKAYHNRNEHDLVMMRGPIQTQEQVTKKIKSFLKMHHLEKRYEITWSSSFVARTTINKNTIKLRLPADFRKEGLLGMLYHEIGTHALRRINYEKQPWFKKKKKYGLTTNYLRTEEGLAVLNALIPKTCKYPHKSAIYYLASYYSHTLSFSEIWKKFSKYLQDHNQLWLLCLRQKRGLIDTSQPGGYTKDLVYFEGVIGTWKWLQKHNFDITQLYFGKIAYQDVDQAVQPNSNFKPQLPSFFTTNKTHYQHEMKTIGEQNHFQIL